MTDPAVRGLAEVVTDVALFFEFSDETIVDPDAALQRMEMLAFRLQDLAKDLQLALTAEIRSIADEDGRNAEFLRRLPEALDLAR